MSRAIASNIRLKRVYDAPSPEDGYRVLSMRYWPRGVPRAAVHEYTTKVAPSRELLYAFKHEGLAWEPYVERYLTEMQSETAQREIARVAQLAQSRTVTLMCGCEDETRCHRGLLRDLIVATPMQGALL